MLTSLIRSAGSPIRSRRLLLAIGAVGMSAALAACGGSSSSSGGSGSWSSAASVASGGGMNKLVAAAKKEGTLNVIALPPTWANYGEQLSAFSKKYGIKIVSANPGGSSQDEINAVKQLGSQSRAPDVLDVGQSFATADAPLFAPYKVTTWSGIPSANKDPNGNWYNDYGGYISFGCNTKLVKQCPTSFKQLLSPQYHNQVALDGDPTQANAAFSGVWAAALANGGSLSNIKPGLDFFHKLMKEGNFVRTQATQATIQSGQTPIVIDWDYLNAAAAAKVKNSFPFKVTVPTDANFAAYYAQAINKKAPHPAAARLWEEFLFSNQGQNLWLKGLARPIRLTQMTKAGTADKTFLSQLPQANPNVQYPTNAETTTAKSLLAQQWAQGG
jgi:putative spermidine/putrescine transport system substrate-binding protein